MTSRLLFSPWRTKTQLSPAKYNSLTVAVSRFLFHTVSLPDIKLDVNWTRAFVSLYAQDVARHILHFPDDDAGLNEDRISAEELSIRALTLKLARRLANLPDGLKVETLVDLAVVYGTGNVMSVQALFTESFKRTPGLLHVFKTEVLPAFAAVLQNAPDRRSAHVLSQLLNCSPQVALLFAEDGEFVVELARGYQVGLDDLAVSRGGITLSSPNKVNSWQKDWLHTKTGLLDVFQAMVQTLLQSPLPKHADHLFDIIFAILDLPSSSVAPKTPFVSQPLLSDYQYAFDLSSALSEKFRNADDARVDLLAATLNDLSPAPRGPKSVGVLSILLKNRTRPRNISKIPVADSKGKGKAKAVEQELEFEGVLDFAVSQVLDIFPAEKPQHIERCLTHPIFNGDPEKLISALLEGTLPPELADDTAAQDIPQKEEFEFIKDRRNVWDEDAMDYSRLRIGKTRDDADELLQDRSFVEQMKADIIRRAEELLEDGEAAVETRDRTVAFEDELGDDVESIVDKGVKVVGDGEDSDNSDDGGNAGEPAPNSPETILELAYIDDPKLFDRDAATRRSKSRTDLKVRTGETLHPCWVILMGWIKGWGDEQIEGWRIMLERNPEKDKILQKHEFSGNAPLVLNTNVLEPGPSDSSRGGPYHRGRGGDGRGRGHGDRRGGGGADSARGRAWKDKNKARQGNHNRKRGHDKKMARGGGGTPL